MKKIIFAFIISCLTFQLWAQNSNLPYPVILVHGLKANHHVWDDLTYEWNSRYGWSIAPDPLKVCLNFDGNPEKNNLDVSAFEAFPGPGTSADIGIITPGSNTAYNVYTVNFNVAPNGDELGNNTILVNKPISIEPNNEKIPRTRMGLQIGGFAMNLHAGQYLRCKDSSGFVDFYFKIVSVNLTDPTYNLTVEKDINDPDPGMIDPYFEFHSLELINLSNQEAIVKQGKALQSIIEYVLAKTGSDKVVLVGHDMGGLAARAYLQWGRNGASGVGRFWQKDGKHHVAKLVTLGAPNSGSNPVDMNAEFLTGVDLKSSAIRDLYYYYDGGSFSPDEGLDKNPAKYGLFLYGGNEQNIPAAGFYSQDVNCDGAVNSVIAGINSLFITNVPDTASPLPGDVDYFWVIGQWRSAYDPAGTGDGFVRADRQFLSNGEIKIIEAAHTLSLGSCAETTAFDAIIEALDETDMKENAYQLLKDVPVNGFITHQGNWGDKHDQDWYKYSSSFRQKYSFRISNSPVQVKATLINGITGQELSSKYFPANTSDTISYSNIEQPEYPNQIYLKIEGDAQASDPGFTDGVNSCSSNLLNCRQPYKILTTTSIENPLLYSSGILPAVGDTSTVFKFSIFYSDTSNQAPAENLKLVVDNVSPYSMNPLSSEWRNGVKFEYNADKGKFALGTHYFHFEATNNGILKRFPKSGELQFTVSAVGNALVSLAPQSQTIRNDVEFKIELNVANVSNCFAFAADLFYDQNKIEFLRAEEGSLFSENGKTKTSFMTSSQKDLGKVILGLSRIENPQRGMSVLQPQSIITLYFKPKVLGQTEISLREVGLLALDGKTSYPLQVNNTSLNVIEERRNVSVSLVPVTQNIFAGETFDVDLKIAPIDDFFAISGVVDYDPSRLEFVDVFESTLLNDSGKVQTSLSKSIQPENGKCFIGLSRVIQGSNGVTTTFTKTVLTVRFKSKLVGSANINIINVGVLASNRSITYDVQVQNTSITSLVYFGKANLNLSPSSLVIKTDSLALFNLEIDSVKNAFSVNGNLLYDKDQVQFIRIEEGNFFNMDGGATYPLIVSVDTIASKVSFELSRVGAQNGPLSTMDRKSLIKAVFKPRKAGTSSIATSNVQIKNELGYGSGQLVNTQASLVALPVKVNISGQVSYQNMETLLQTPLQDVNVFLKGTASAMDSSTTDAAGNFIFSGKTNDTYLLSAATSKAWGGVNSTDALWIQQYFAGIRKFDSLQFKAADVNRSGQVNSGDALIIRQRTIGVINSFLAGDWVFENPVLTVNNSDVNINLRALCTGDVNGSYNFLIAKPKPSIALIRNTETTFANNDTIEVKVSVNKILKFNALTLLLNYNSANAILTGVKSNLEGLTYSITENQANIAWADIKPVSPDEGGKLLSLIFKLKDKNEKNLNLQLSLAPGSEMADENGNVIENATINIPELSILRVSGFQLAQNYPNPFNPSTTIKYSLPADSHVKIVIFNSLGQVVKTLVDEMKSAGIFEARFDAGNLSSGIYFCSMIAKSDDGLSSFRTVNKLILMK